ncbi:hypothetical protein Aeqsu_0408 [Aequorivita sublithincola DSM 14238]|uniref:Curlin associated repeat-containing protein n=1 Tax=Aequorivita sublithincola (strain DSM 14238 / LMG 21431 / ACAM 643 / 9-3) TaxID=746697 RepID=I3YSF3_AEQSU|nr:hypothetical protein [Aequorivita sublithincola]AFL79921.1 hypothetical protein Aeqsu_0408 [Aequorivita sublithincola DSM 14238]
MMKTTIKNVIFGILLSAFFIPTISGQTYKPEDNNTNGDKNIIQGENVSPEMLTNLGIITAPNPKNALIQGNSVYVRQIGDFNTSRIVTNTNASEINLLQNGDYNNTNLDYTANTAVTDLIQNGNNNRIRDFVNNPDADISLDLIQNGSNLNFEREGVNELTKSLKFRQTEASPTIIVRSFY